MKTKITLFIGAVALVTLSFTFAGPKETSQSPAPAAAALESQPVGGLYAADMVK